MRRTLSVFNQFKNDEDGAALIEYTVLLGLMLVAVVATIGLVGTWISGQWTTLTRRCSRRAAWPVRFDRGPRQNPLRRTYPRVSAGYIRGKSKLGAVRKARRLSSLAGALVTIDPMACNARGLCANPDSRTEP
jgi:pilus assembly protein Flp/PilA